MSVGEEVEGGEGQGNGVGCSPERKHMSAGSSVLRFSSLWQVGTLGEVSAEYSSVPQVWPGEVNVSADGSVPGRGGL